MNKSIWICSRCRRDVTRITPINELEFVPEGWRTVEPVRCDACVSTLSVFKVKVYPHREKVSMGNIIWADRDHGSAYYRTSKFAMRAGKWPADHPVGGTHHAADSSQGGSGAGMDAFRARGYWASCFPEGDGITWKPTAGQSDDKCLTDIRECFGWNASWAPGVQISPDVDSEGHCTRCGLEVEPETTHECPPGFLV